MPGKEGIGSKRSGTKGKVRGEVHGGVRRRDVSLPRSSGVRRCRKQKEPSGHDAPTFDAGRLTSGVYDYASSRRVREGEETPVVEVKMLMQS